MTKSIKVADISREVWKRVAAEIENFSTGMTLNKTFIGSGTFISWDGKFGILTAEHVVNNPTSSRLSLDFSGQHPQVLQLIIAQHPHVLAFPVSYLTNVSLGKRDSDDFGPDLSVIILPQSPQLELTKAKKSFWPLDVKTELKIEKAISNQGVVIFSGFPAEKLGTPGPAGGFQEAQLARGLAGVTQQVDYFEKNGFDYVEAKSVREPASDALTSYGGMSGGGFWRVPLYMDKEDSPDLFTGLFLLGTVFWQGPEQDGHRILRAHGPKTIYDALLKKLREGR